MGNGGKYFDESNAFPLPQAKSKIAWQISEQIIGRGHPPKLEERMYILV